MFKIVVLCNTDKDAPVKQMLQTSDLCYINSKEYICSATLDTISPSLFQVRMHYIIYILQTEKY